MNIVTISSEIGLKYRQVDIVMQISTPIMKTQIDNVLIVL